MATFARQRALAARLISQSGGVATLLQAGGTLDPIAGTLNAVGPTQTPIRMVAITPGRGAEAVVGSLVGRDVRQAFIALEGLSVSILTGDRIVWAGITWNVIAVNLLDPAGDGAVIATAYLER